MCKNLDLVPLLVLIAIFIIHFVIPDNAIVKPQKDIDTEAHDKVISFLNNFTQLKDMKKILMPENDLHKKQEYVCLIKYIKKDNTTYVYATFVDGQVGLKKSLLSEFDNDYTPRFITSDSSEAHRKLVKSWEEFMIHKNEFKYFLKREEYLAENKVILCEVTLDSKDNQ